MITKSGVKISMESQPDARPTACVIRGNYNTRVFDFPKGEPDSEEHLRPAVIVERASCKGDNRVQSLALLP